MLKPKTIGGRKLKANILKQYDNRMVITEEMIAAALIDPHMKDQNFVLQYIDKQKTTKTNFLKKIYKKLNVSDNFEVETQTSSPEIEVIEDLNEIIDFYAFSDDEDDMPDTLTKEVELYLKEPIPTETDVLLWWKSVAKKYKRLSWVAIKYLAMTATSSDVESCFSTSGCIVTAKRSLLTTRRAEMLMYLKQNMYIIEN